MYTMKLDVLLGLQWGDEGKGKVVDFLTPHYDIIARFQGGANAGHTLEIEGDKHILHLIPSGIFHENKINVIGNGVIIDPFILYQEIQNLHKKNVDVESRLLLSKKSHLILPTHRLLDGASEIAKGKLKIGSTLKGIGPTYTDKAGRNGIRMGHIFDPDFRSEYEKLKQQHLKQISLLDWDYSEYLIDGLLLADYEDAWFDAIDRLMSFRIIDSEQFINNSLATNQSVLAEGAQGTMLDVDHGTYPYVTSSNTICSGVCSGLGISPHKIGNVYGIVKAYTTRVGSGPFPTELECKTGDELRKVGNEFGSTTGRPRRCGWLDLVALNYSIMLNGVTSLIMTKADVLSGFKEIKAATKYIMGNEEIDFFPFEASADNLTPVYEAFAGWQDDISTITDYTKIPDELVNYIRFIEEYTSVKFGMISVGPGREQTFAFSDNL